MPYSSSVSDPRAMNAGIGPERTSSIVPLRAGGARKPLFIVHGVDGRLARFSTLAANLGEADRPILGIQAQALVEGAPALTRLEEQAAFYLQEIRAVQPEGPYHLLGYSFGAFVALEIAQQLIASGGQCGLLGVLDNLRMGSSSAGPDEPKRRVAWLTSHLIHLRRPGGIAYAGKKLEARFLRMAYMLLDAIGQPIPTFIRRPYDINWFAAVRYVPREYRGRITIFQTLASALDEKATHDYWARLAGGGIDTVEVPGSHETLFVEPNVQLLARAIAASLKQLD